VRYLAPEVVLLFKSKTLLEKNSLDFVVAVDTLGEDALIWLTEALSLVYGDSHIWLRQLEDR
jgi:hypothetical protein